MADLLISLIAIATIVVYILGSLVFLIAVLHDTDVKVRLKTPGKRIRVVSVVAIGTLGWPIILVLARVFPVEG